MSFSSYQCKKIINADFSHLKMEKAVTQYVRSTTDLNSICKLRNFFIFYSFWLPETLRRNTILLFIETTVVSAKSSGSYDILRQAFWLNLSKITPVQQPHCPSKHEQGNLNPCSGGFDVVASWWLGVVGCVLFLFMISAFFMTPKTFHIQI